MSVPPRNGSKVQGSFRTFGSWMCNASLFALLFRSTVLTGRGSDKGPPSLKALVPLVKGGGGEEALY